MRRNLLTRPALRLAGAVVLLAGATTPNERVTYGLARDLARQALRELVRQLPAAVTAQILVASETALGPVGSVTQN
jgi:hypothetical protein